MFRCRQEMGMGPEADKREAGSSAFRLCVLRDSLYPHPITSDLLRQ